MKSPRSSAGFSLVELMVVVAIVIVLAATAVPSIMNSINNIRLRSMVGTVSGVIQSGRMLAIHDNRRYAIRFSGSTGSSVVFVDVDGNGAPSASEPQAQLGGTIVQVAAPVGTAALDTATLGYEPKPGDLVFNPRGLPCTTGGACGVGFAIYFTDQRRVGGTGYAAVSVTPAGRVKTWMWAGTSWSD